MKTIIFSIVCIILTGWWPLQGQDRLFGSWVKFHADQADGSPLSILERGDGGRVSLVINETEVCLFLAPYSSRPCLKYAVDQNVLRLGSGVNLKFQHLGADTLVMVETDLALGSDQLKRHFYVNKRVWMEEERIGRIRDTIRLKPGQAPGYVGDVVQEIQNYLTNNVHEVGSLDAEVVFDFTKKKVVLIPRIVQGLDKRTLREIRKAFAATKRNWVFPLQYKYPLVAMPVRLKLDRVNRTAIFTRVAFFPLQINERSLPVGSEDSQRANSYYQQAIFAAESLQYDEAISLFTESYAQDSTLGSALVYRGFMHLLKGDEELACQDYRRLYSIDPDRSRRLLGEHCSQESVNK